MIKKHLETTHNRTPVTVDEHGNERRIILSHIGEEFAEGSPAPSMPDEKIWRGSMAASCSRQIAYRLCDTEKTTIKLFFKPEVKDAHNK